MEGRDIRIDEFNPPSYAQTGKGAALRCQFTWMSHSIDLRIEQDMPSELIDFAFQELVLFKSIPADGLLIDINHHFGIEIMTVRRSIIKTIQDFENNSI